MVDYIFAVDGLIPDNLALETNLDQFGLSTDEDDRARAPLHLWLKVGRSVVVWLREDTE